MKNCGHCCRGEDFSLMSFPLFGAQRTRRRPEEPKGVIAPDSIYRAALKAHNLLEKSIRHVIV